MHYTVILVSPIDDHSDVVLHGSLRFIYCM